MRTMNINEPHPLAGQTVQLAGIIDHPNFGVMESPDFEVEDWWIRLTGGSWMVADGNPACLLYAMRSGFAGLPVDNWVVYGKVNNRGTLVHVSELPEVV